MHEPNVTYGAQRQKKRAIDLVHNWSKLQSWELVPKIQVWSVDNKIFIAIQAFI